MKITRFTEEQIIAAIRSQVSGEKTVEKVCRELGISQATFFNVEAEVWWDDDFRGQTLANAGMA